MKFVAGLPLLLPLCACASLPPQPIPVVAEARQCPALPSPPSILLEPVKRPSFLPKT